MHIMFDNDSIGRSDVHPLAAVETDDPMMECLTCGLPVPEEAHGDVFCNEQCKEEALLAAIFAAEDKDFFAWLFPQVVAAEEPGLPECECSCNH